MGKNGGGGENFNGDRWHWYQWGGKFLSPLRLKGQSVVSIILSGSVDGHDDSDTFCQVVGLVKCLATICHACVWFPHSVQGVWSLKYIWFLHVLEATLLAVDQIHRIGGEAVKMVLDGELWSGSTAGKGLTGRSMLNHWGAVGVFTGSTVFAWVKSFSRRFSRRYSDASYCSRFHLVCFIYLFWNIMIKSWARHCTPSSSFMINFWHFYTNHLAAVGSRDKHAFIKPALPISDCAVVY